MEAAKKNLFFVTIFCIFLYPKITNFLKNSFTPSKDNDQMSRLLKSRTNIYITRPDKLSDVVILNYSGYIKMPSILDNTSKFQ